MRHGTNVGYTNHGCRCDECKVAHAEWSRDWAARNFASVQASQKRSIELLRQRLAANDPTVRHGSTRTYNAGCRCEPCTAETSTKTMERNRRLRARKKAAAQ